MRTLLNKTFIALLVALSLSTVAFAQVEILNSPDSPGSTGLANMNLQTLLRNAGVGSYIFPTAAQNGGFATDQIAERAFMVQAGFTPQIDVLFSTSVRQQSAGWFNWHRIGWYQRDASALPPAESAIRDVVWENQAAAAGNTNSRAKLTTTASDFTGLDMSRFFELRLTSATANDARSGSVYGNDAFNPSNFRNIVYFKERDLNGNLINNSYLVAWEDQRGGGDRDYNDMVVRIKYVQAINPNNVPEPATLALALGIAPLTLARRRRNK